MDSSKKEVAKCDDCIWHGCGGKGSCGCQCHGKPEPVVAAEWIETAAREIVEHLKKISDWEAISVEDVHVCEIEKIIRKARGQND